MKKTEVGAPSAVPSTQPQRPLKGRGRIYDACGDNRPRPFFRKHPTTIQVDADVVHDHDVDNADDRDNDKDDDNDDDDDDDNDDHHHRCNDDDGDDDSDDSGDDGDEDDYDDENDNDYHDDHHPIPCKVCEKMLPDTKYSGAQWQPQKLCFRLSENQILTFFQFSYKC